MFDISAEECYVLKKKIFERMIRKGNFDWLSCPESFSIDTSREI